MSFRKRAQLLVLLVAGPAFTEPLWQWLSERGGDGCVEGRLSSSLVEQGCQQHFCRVFVCQLYCLGWLCVTCANGQNGSKLVFVPQKISCSTLAAGSSVSRQERWGAQGACCQEGSEER